LANCEPHGSDFLLLGDDDFLSQPPDLRVSTVAKDCNSHVDRPLMVGHHHCNKIQIDVTGRRDRHTAHHSFHCRVVLDQIRAFPTDVAGGC